MNTAVSGKCFILEVLPAFGNVSSLQISNGCTLHEWEGVLHIQFAIHMFSKCVLSEFAYLNVLHVHLLKCNYKSKKKKGKAIPVTGRGGL
jgi:hypothetical protein